MGLGFSPEMVEADTIPYHRYTTHDGLPSKDILSLTQTSNGLLWIGTRSGLVVYDGRSFRSISMPDSVRQKQVFALQPMPDGSVWAGVGHDAVRVSPHGVTRVLPLDEHLHSAILRRGDEVLFVTDRAVWTLGPSDRRPVRTPFRYQTLSSVTVVREAGLGPEGALWILNPSRGPGRVQADGTVAFPDDVSFPRAGGEFSGFRFFEEGTALVAAGTHLFRFAPRTGTVDPIADDLTARTTIHGNGRIAYLAQASSLRRYDTQAQDWLEPIESAPGTAEATTTVAHRGREGGLWVGTKTGLLHFMAPEARHVKTIGGVSLQAGAGFRQQGQVLWSNTWGDGLFQLRPRRRRVTPDGHTRWVLSRSHDGQVHGLTAPASGPARQWYRWTPENGWRFVALARDAVRGYVDTSGVGYFWHNDGLYRHVPAGDTTRRTRLRAWTVEESQHHLMGPAPNGDIILFDQGEVLRLGRPEGRVLDTIASVPEHADAQGRRLQVDDEGRIWFPFKGAGLLRVDAQSGASQTFLEGAVIESVEMAGDSLAMAETNEGLYLLNANTGAVRRHLTEADGLLSNDVNGSHLREDTLYVGHLTGYTLLPADSLLRPPSRPQAVLTGREVNLENRSLSGDTLLDENERSVGFSYTAASLSGPDRVRFEERLLPRDSSWNATSRRFARYTNLEAGTYRFEVRARLAEGGPGPVATHTFTIPPHFYETGWFRLLVVLGLFGLGGGVYRWRTVRLRRRQEQLEQAVEERTRALAEEKEKTKEQAQRLAELDEAKNRFFAHVSHEFRTPLSLILSPLREGVRKGERLGLNQMERMADNADRLRRLIDQLLDLATLEAGRLDLDRQPGDLAAVVERSAAAFHSKAEEKGVDLAVERPDGRIETRFDPDKVETMVSNLVGNAVKFTPAGGAVAVRVTASESTAGVEVPPADEAVEGTARIEVADTGPGIEPDVQDQIFDRFEQADTSMTRAHEGTGLGLALTSELVELHGGTITVESTPGDGATFIVQLPIVPVASPSAEAQERKSTGGQEQESMRERAPGGDGRAEPTVKTESDAGEATVLVVEDNAEMRAYLREELSPRWAVVEAADGEEGWERVQAEAPALVISDVMMPGTDGFELCRRIKDDEQLRTIPVLLLTARAGEEAAHEGLSCGADDYVTKPFDAAELRQRITNHLAARRHLKARYREEVELASQVVEAEDRSFVETLLETIDDHLGNPDLTVGRLADEMALSRRQFSRRVKKATGDPPGAVIQQHRLNRAKAMLEADPDTIAEVAYAVGFQSPSSFSRAFREKEGRTPSEYVDTHVSQDPSASRD